MARGDGGTVSLYDALGERQHTIYIGATPEYGKALFLERLEREIQRTKAVIPKRPILALPTGQPPTGNFSPVIPANRFSIFIMPLAILVLWLWRCTLKT
jgi:hypothetical protein